VRREADFLDFKIFKFPSKTANLATGSFFSAPIIPNIHMAISILTGFFPVDPLPTPVFCRNMA